MEEPEIAPDYRNGRCIRCISCVGNGVNNDFILSASFDNYDGAGDEIERFDNRDPSLGMAA